MLNQISNHSIAILHCANNELAEPDRKSKPPNGSFNPSRNTFVASPSPHDTSHFHSRNLRAEGSLQSSRPLWRGISRGPVICTCVTALKYINDDTSCKIISRCLILTTSKRRSSAESLKFVHQIDASSQTDEEGRL